MHPDLQLDSANGDILRGREVKSTSPARRHGMVTGFAWQTAAGKAAEMSGGDRHAGPPACAENDGKRAVEAECTSQLAQLLECEQIEAVCHAQTLRFQAT